MLTRGKARAAMTATVLAVVALAVTVLVAGGRRRDAQAADGVVRLVVSPAHAVRTNAAELARLQSLLSAESGLDVRIRVARSAVDAIESFSADGADAGLLTVFEYMLAHREYGAAARLRVVREGRADYSGEILVRADSPVRTVGDLASRRIGYSDPYSMSGFVLPAALLARSGVAPHVQFSGSHDRSLKELQEGAVDAIATFAGAAAGQPGLRALAVTETVPNEPVFLRRNIAPAAAAAFLRALQAVAASDEGRPLLTSLGGITGFAPVDDAAYGPVAAILRQVGQGVEDLVPGGWVIWSRNRIDYWP